MTATPETAADATGALLVADVTAAVAVVLVRSAGAAAAGAGAAGTGAAAACAGAAGSATAAVGAAGAGEAAAGARCFAVLVTVVVAAAPVGATAVARCFAPVVPAATEAVAASAVDVAVALAAATTSCVVTVTSLVVAATDLAGSTVVVTGPAACGAAVTVAAAPVTFGLTAETVCSAPLVTAAVSVRAAEGAVAAAAATGGGTVTATGAVVGTGCDDATRGPAGSAAARSGVVTAVGAERTAAAAGLRCTEGFRCTEGAETCTGLAPPAGTALVFSRSRVVAAAEGIGTAGTASFPAAVEPWRPASRSGAGTTVVTPTGAVPAVPGPAVGVRCPTGATGSDRRAAVAPVAAAVPRAAGSLRRTNAAATTSVPAARESANVNAGIDDWPNARPLPMALSPPKMLGIEGDASSRTPHAATAETVTSATAVEPWAGVLAACIPTPAGPPAGSPRCFPWPCPRFAATPLRRALPLWRPDRPLTPEPLERRGTGRDDMERADAG